MTYRNEHRTKFLIITVCTTVISATLIGQMFGFFQPTKTQVLPSAMVASFEQIQT